jgi:ribonuclease HII
MKYIIGADEVGYGALAGPLVTCAVAVSEDWPAPAGLRDSKKMSPAMRESVYQLLYGLPMYISASTSEIIDTLGVGKMLIAAHTQTIREMQQRFPNATVILDGNMRLPDLPHVHCVPKADSKYPAVMAAACIAKVNRDRLMLEYAKQYPGYAFEENMGYNSPAHLEGLRKLGRCRIHRLSYHIKAYDGARA